MAELGHRVVWTSPAIKLHGRARRLTADQRPSNVETTSLQKAQRSAKRSAFGSRCAALKVAVPPAALPLSRLRKKRGTATFSGSAAIIPLRYRFLSWARSGHPLHCAEYFFSLKCSSYTVGSSGVILVPQKAQRSAKRSGFGSRCAALMVAAPPAALPLFWLRKKQGASTFSGSAAIIPLRYCFLGWARSGHPLRFAK
ncbi:hypothetical protein PCANC_01174 [Puccinia coronata f. sp. avenae]|uniref:Uncharacterized protein n=1 Tax=Puccinia coronata f. sp. avenae TaxID=200324 RepID=A0A2N5W5S4_9BASI|nr:hypothetical protein PCANC_01174 [Puccinia coronata f. sp. avenae]